MKYATVNPVNNHLLAEFDFDPLPNLDLSMQAFAAWKNLTVEQRGEQLRKVAVLLEQRKQQYAALITLEMGKPLREAEYEINKTISAFDYYIAQAPAFLAPQAMPSNASNSYVRFDPLGIIFSIMPWNFPFWQVFRFAIPTLISGNVTILKHAPNVPQCARAIAQLFTDAGLPAHVFVNCFLTNHDAATLIADSRVRGLSFTGSDTTGSLLAAQAGQAIKKCVMELGGNDAFIVLNDVDVDFAVAGAIKSRSINTGQSCNGAKRFIVTKQIAPAFTQALVKAVQDLQVGSPLNEQTQVGPLARRDLQQKALQQVQQTIEAGAVAHYGQPAPDTAGNWFSPVVLTGVKPGMVAFEQEIFAPVWSIIEVNDLAEAIATANNSAYGLGASVWSANQQAAEHAAAQLDAGNVFINDIVKSDPRMPFGGVKRSGFGRELSDYGLKEFVNVKTVYIR